MLYLPKYSIGSIVDLNDGESGKIVNIEANLKTGKTTGIYKTYYFVEIGDEVKRVLEKNIKDNPEIEPKIVDDMDKFLADSLLLTRHNTPNERIDNTIKELLNLDVKVK